MTEGSIELFYEVGDYEYIEIAELNAWIRKTLHTEGRELHYLNIIFCNDDYLLKINQDYLHHDYYTDIITFQYADAPIEGELFISLERVKDNAKSQQVSWTEELDRVIIHGVLHLVGYKDHTEPEKKSIRSKEDFYLSTRNDSNTSL